MFPIEPARRQDQNEDSCTREAESMRRFTYLAVLLICVGCSQDWRSLSSAAPADAGVATTGPQAMPQTLQLPRPVTGFARLPDRGDLVHYPSKPPTRDASGAVWHRADISEEHALNAIARGVLRVTLPSGDIQTFRYRRHVEHPTGDWTWIGRLDGDPASGEAILTFGDRATFGSIARPGRSPLELTVRDGVSWLVEVDQRRSPASDRVDYLVPPTGRESSGDTPLPATPAIGVESFAATAMASTVIDVVLGYTQGMVTQYGSQSATVTRLTSLVDISNQAYRNSLIDGELRLVHAMQVDFGDLTDNEAALEQLTGSNGSGGNVAIPPGLAALRSAREQYGADLVSLVRKFNDPEHDGCGVAWLLKTPMDARFGYSVVSDGSDGGFGCRLRTLAHELGHNMGQAHNAEDTTGAGMHPYSYGYREASPTGFYTIMAYPVPTATDSTKTNQEEINHFANPNVPYDGRPTGIANASDNARSLAQSMPIVAQFRATVVAPPPVVATGRRNDVNGDGRSDVLWHNVGLQQFDWWLMDGAQRLAVGSKAIASQYSVAATGDFNGDGRSDVLWRDSTTLWIWQSEASGTYSIQFVAAYPASGWSVAGAGDVDGDGRSDILWHNPGLELMDWWRMDGATRLAIGRKAIANQYRVSAIGDFNGDRRADILWRDNSTLWTWQSEGSGFSIHYVDSYPAVGWVVVGAGDIDGDGRSDILWHNVGQQLVDWWLMNGATRQGLGRKAIASQYRVAAIGDFNGDGRSDVFWRDDAKTTLWIWRSEPAGGFAIDFVGGYPPPGWEILGK